MKKEYRKPKTVVVAATISTLLAGSNKTLEVKTTVPGGTYDCDSKGYYDDWEED